MKHLLTGIAVFVIAGATTTSCNHKTKEKAGPAFSDKIGPLHVTYAADKPNVGGELLKVTDEQRRRLLEAADLRREAFEGLYGTVPSAFVQIWIDRATDEAVPCGVPNGGGCFVSDSRLIMVGAGDYDEVPHLVHELYHQHQWLKHRWLDPGHYDKGWFEIDMLDVKVGEQIKASRTPPLAQPLPLNAPGLGS